MGDVPEMKFLSGNTCPNAGPDWIFGDACPPGGLTMWGYCGRCWQHPEVWIPREWIERVDAMRRST